MTQFYLRERKDTIAYKQAPALPAGFFGKKKNNIYINCKKKGIPIMTRIILLITFNT